MISIFNYRYYECYCTLCCMYLQVIRINIIIIIIHINTNWRTARHHTEVHFEGSVPEYLNSKITILKKCKKIAKEPHNRNSMELRFCCSEHKTDPLQSPCKLYDHIIGSPELRYCGPTWSVQYSKVSCQVVTTHLCILWIQSELELRFCCTEIAGVASFNLIPKSHFCQKWS